MVTFLAEGKVNLYRSEGDMRDDGEMPIEVARQQHMETQQTVEIIMAHGHVNLDAYAPESHGLAVSEVVGVEAMCPEGWDTAEIDGREWSTRLSGSRDEWIRAAVRWISERPDSSVMSALSAFAAWDEANSDVVMDAFDEVAGDGMSRVESAYEGANIDVPHWLDESDVHSH